MRFREDNPADLDRARAAVAAWRAQNPAGTDEQLIAALGHQFHRDYAVVLRSVLFAVDRHRAHRITGVITGNAGQAGDRPRAASPARPALRVVDGTGPEDAVVRRRRFEQAHPEAVILPPAAGRWRAVVPPGLIPGDDTSTTLGSWDLADLMDQLDEIYPADSGDTAG